MKTHTISYISGKLDRSNTPKPTFESTTKVVLRKVDRYLYSKFAKFMQALEKANEWLEYNMPKNGNKMNRSIEFAEVLKKANEQRQAKTIYTQWSAPATKSHLQRVKYAINQRQWEQYLVKGGKL